MLTKIIKIRNVGLLSNTTSGGGNVVIGTGGTLVNTGTITNSCGGTLTGQVKGNQPVDACSLV